MQSISRQQLGKHVQRATVEDVPQWTNVIACCYATVSAPINSLATNHVTSVLCVVRVDPI
jgi:hypothetical protein